MPSVERSKERPSSSNLRLTLRMHGFAGIVVFLEASVLLVIEPDYFTGEPCWTFPSGHIEPGELPVTAAIHPKTEPIAHFLTSGERNLHWTFDLTDMSTPPTFRWNPPVRESPV